MPVDITNTLTDEQVAKSLEFARLARPEATNAELRADLEQAALNGPGIRPQILRWARDAARAYARDAYNSHVSEFEALFGDVT